MQTRLFQYDALKALSIFLVILGHIFIYTFNQGDNTIVSFINVVNMGMFMFISGFFAGIPTFHGLKKRVRTLLLPTITVGLLYTCIKGGGNFESFLFNQIHLGYWFCLTLFLIYVIHLCSFYIGRGIAKRVKSGIILDVCLILCVLALLLCYALFYHESVPGEALSIPETFNPNTNILILP